MSVQAESARVVIARCNEAGNPGRRRADRCSRPGIEEFDGVDHFVLNEAEITLPLFLDDLGTGGRKHLYTTTRGRT